MLKLNRPHHHEGGASQRWWLLIMLFISFQGFILWRWSQISAMVVADHRLLYRRDRSVRGDARFATVEEGVSKQEEVTRVTNERLMERLVANITSAFESRDVDLVQLGFKLMEREKEMEKMQQKLLDLMARRGVRESSEGDGEGDEFAGTGEAQEVPKAKVERCNRQKDVGRKGKVKWLPKEGKYLFAICVGGQLSNRLSCLRQNMLDAALLNRTLIFPSQGVDYNYRSLLDLEAPRTCFGNNSFLTLDEYLQRQGLKSLTIDLMVCHVHTYQNNRVCSSIESKFRHLNVTFGRIVIPELRTNGPWYKYTSQDFVHQFGYSEKIIAFGNTFGVGGADHRFRGSAPMAVSPECKYYILPSPAIYQTAAGFVNSFLGSNFLAVHMRRGDFFQHCVKSKGHSAKPCYHPMQQMASCLQRRMAENAGTRMLYLSTNADAMEISTLKEVLSMSKTKVILVRMPKPEDQPWAEPIAKLGLVNDTNVVSFVEKTICVLSKVFYGTYGSTFTGDITRLRDWLFTRSCEDANICPDNEAAETIPDTP